MKARDDREHRLACADLETKIRKLVADHFLIEHRHVSDETEFLRDLGVDWLDRLELIILLEDHFGIEIPDAQLDEIGAVGDLIRVVSAFAEKAGLGTSTQASATA